MEREYVGIDVHRRRSVVVRVSAGGERLSVVRVDNDPVALAAVVADAGPGICFRWRERRRKAPLSRSQVRRSVGATCPSLGVGRDRRESTTPVRS